MACYWLHQNETDITIPKIEEIDGVTQYVIEVKVGNVVWKVKHRYNDFYMFHQTLVTDHGLAKDSLPPKKVINNKCLTFIETRRQGLEAYLKSTFKYLQRTMPRTFLNFLHFHKYDIFFMLQTIAYQFYMKADYVLQSSKHYPCTVLQLHAISECFKNPYPAVEEADNRYDLSHVLDFCSQLQHLLITGEDAPYMDSNIVPNDLPFELTAFRSLRSFQMHGVRLKYVNSIGNLRNSLRKLEVQKSPTESISEVLMCDVIHKTVASENEIWHKITELNLKFNCLDKIDDAIKLVPNVRTLILTGNKITDINNLTHLTKLSHISLAMNCISNLTSLHTKLGNVISIDLSSNSITSLQGFGKLYSLESLDVSMNQISDIEEIKYIGELPCLEYLSLTGNPVAVSVDYRVKVLEHFGQRACEIYLDNEQPTQKEIDTACVLKALRIVKEGKTPNLNQNNFQ